MTQNEINEINAWLNSERNYQAGLQLFEKHSKSTAMKRIFQGKESRYAGKLLYELRKLIPSGPTPDIPAAKPVKLSGLKPAETANSLIESIGEPDPSLPLIIRRLIAQFSDLYKSRSIAHNSLKAVPPDNRVENMELRRIIVEKMKKYSDRMDELQYHHNEYKTKNIVPDEETLFAGKTQKSPSVESENLDELSRLRLNLQKSLNRDNNLLHFQMPTRQPATNEMRAGPKRTALLSRIKEKKTEIARLTSRIDGINKVLGNTPAGIEPQ
ncbi:MAG: hypothetical protein WCW62_06905 [Bacteroidales bacterium]|jgi:hypothetical protein